MERRTFCMVLLALALGGCMECGRRSITDAGSWAATWAHEVLIVPSSRSRCGVGGCWLGLPSRPNLAPSDRHNMPSSCCVRSMNVEVSCTGKKRLCGRKRKAPKVRHPVQGSRLHNESARCLAMQMDTCSILAEQTGQGATQAVCSRLGMLVCRLPKQARHILPGFIAPGAVCKAGVHCGLRGLAGRLRMMSRVRATGHNSACNP